MIALLPIAIDADLARFWKQRCENKVAGATRADGVIAREALIREIAQRSLSREEWKVIV